MDATTRGLKTAMVELGRDGLEICAWFLVLYKKVVLCISVSDPDLIRSVDSDPDPEGQKWPTKKKAITKCF